MDEEKPVSQQSTHPDGHRTGRSVAQRGSHHVLSLTQSLLPTSAEWQQDDSISNQTNTNHTLTP